MEIFANIHFKLISLCFLNTLLGADRPCPFASHKPPHEKRACNCSKILLAAKTSIQIKVLVSCEIHTKYRNIDYKYRKVKKTDRELRKQM